MTDAKKLAFAYAAETEHDINVPELERIITENDLKSIEDIRRFEDKTSVEGHRSGN